MKTDFHNKDFAHILALKWRLRSEAGVNRTAFIHLVSLRLAYLRGV